MKYRGTIITDASGSLNGVTFSHNRGGAYTRNRAIPTNPNTIYQQAVRGFNAQLSSAWLNVLTPAQRAAWDVYAENVLLPDTIGEPRNAGGLGMYIRSNVPRLQAGLARVDDGPTTYNLGDVTNPSVTDADAGAGDSDVTFNESDDWVGEDGAAMLWLISRGQNASINYFKGPYRFAGTIDGDSTTPPTSPATLTLPFPVAAGQRVFYAARVTRADGRLSSSFRTFVLAT